MPLIYRKFFQSKPLLAGLIRVSRVAVAQKFCDFSTLRGGEGAAEAGAFQRRSGGGEPERLGQGLLFGDGQRERAVEYVAGAERIHSMHRERWRLPQGLALVEPNRAQRAARSRQK